MISQQEYQERRQRVAKKLPTDSVALFFASDEKMRNADTGYPFRQDSTFYYLTGFNEPEALLLILAGDKGDCYLFNRARDVMAEQWTGRRLGQDGACHELGMKDAFPFDSISTHLPDFLRDKSALFYALGQTPLLEFHIQQALLLLKRQIRRGVKAPTMLCDIEPIVSELRLHKSEAEVALIRQAIKASVSAHTRAMQATKIVSYEYELEAELLHEFYRHGSRSPAYASIVASGGNACVLHYADNNCALKSGDLVLIDAGAEFQNYAADITRTFPVNGHYSAEQRAIYALVLDAQQAGIAAIKPGLPWPSIQEIMLRILTQGLCDLGLLKGQVDDLIASEAYKRFYMHNSGHWLGLDVHDCGAYKVDNQWRGLEQGMVLTVEPGLYIPDQDDIDKRWRGIGVRIEDDILVTAEGHENLSVSLPVTIAETEALMRD